MKKDYTNKEYNEYVAKKEPKSKMLKNIALAFIVGGIICVIAECAAQYMRYRGVAQENIKSALPTIMIALSAFLTGMGWYEKIAKHAGGGTIVPITGFANAVASPAIEFKAEGHILGTGAKMFVVAGPVIVFGTVASIIVGFFYYLFG